MATPTARPLRTLAALALVAGAALAAAVPGAATAHGADDPTAEDPNLEQTIDPDQEIVAGPADLAGGHIDIGPRFVDGEFTLLVHDDASEPPVWRDLDEAVAVVTDAALQTVPDDPAYDFLGVEPGTEVHVVPQVQRDGVVWVGWNTQDPEVLETVELGATLTLLDVAGPGELTVFLQSGVLGDPEVLWRSTEEGRQSFFVELNTHTHANWVFSEPGTYLVQVEMSADLISGDEVSDVRTLRFAVGDGASADEARAAEDLAAPAPADEQAGATEPAGDDDGDGDRGGSTALVVGLVVAAVVLLALVARGVVAGRRSKALAERERVGAGNRS